MLNSKPSLNSKLKPDSVLGRIVVRKLAQLPEQLKNLDTSNLEKSNRDLFDVLSKHGGHFIYEYKKASPTLGSIREHDTVETIVEQYAPFASAISVLTEYDHFKGELGFIPRAKAVCSHPILCKDFTLVPEQVQQARQYGADVVLLMLSVLDDEQYKKCAKAAFELNIDILTEVHDAKELQRALDLDAKIIGINNRNLADLSINLDTTEELVALIPKTKRKNIRVISESGIKTRTDILRLAPIVDGFLIGSSLMSEPRVDLKLRELVFSSTKICGLTNSVDADLAYMAGAKFGGMILAEGSNRTISIKRATSIAKRTQLPLIAVFRNQTLDYIIESTKKIPLHAVQLHGEESDDYISELRKIIHPDIQIWKTLHVADHLPAAPSVKVDALLLENGNAELAGGSGESFDWALLDTVETKYKDYSIVDIILAGGLNPDNIAKAMQTPLTRFDLASGVENKPGFKNRIKIQQLFTTLREQAFQPRHKK